MAAGKVKTGAGVPSAVDDGQSEIHWDKPGDLIILLLSATAVGSFRTELVTTMTIRD
jgi:hypothetical protein